VGRHEFTLRLRLPKDCISWLTEQIQEARTHPKLASVPIAILADIHPLAGTHVIYTPGADQPRVIASERTPQGNGLEGHTLACIQSR